MSEKSYERWKQIVKAIIGDQQGLTVLDAACGPDDKKRSGNSYSQKLATIYVRDLCHTHLWGPDWDIGLLSGLGFENIRVRRYLERAVHGRTLKRLLSPFFSQFLIQGAKPKP